MMTELLAPAGSFESLRAALLAGADAVYVGGGRFGARAYAQNFGQEELMEAIDLCHLKGKHLYLTVNTLLKERELAGELYDYIAPLYERGLDAVLVQDFGVFRFLKREFPELPLHGSTQMTVHSSMGARFLQEAGASRVVVARELSLEEIRGIRRETSLEIEAFVHGALCYSFSGQCLLSSMIGGRSGNRGRCAQPCRLPYTLIKGERTVLREKYLLSPRDICTLSILPEIIEAGVCSLKIEGRMKNPEYAALTVGIYRKYVDRFLQNGKENWTVEEQDIRDLMDLYNRGGFSTGYYKTRNGREMMSLDCPSHYGTAGAKVQGTEKGKTVLTALEDLNGQDVLEGGYTLGAPVKKGRTFSMRMQEGCRKGKVLRRTKNAALLAELSAFLKNRPEKEKINGKLIISLQKPAILMVENALCQAEARGEMAQPAKNQGLTEDALRKQMEKTGNTPFVFEKLDISVEKGCFQPIQSLNELRRQALDELKRRTLERFFRVLPSREPAKEGGGGGVKEKRDFSFSLTALVQTEEQLAAVLSQEKIGRVYLDGLEGMYRGEKAARYRERCRLCGKEVWAVLPAIFRLETRKTWDREQTARVLASYDGILIRNIEEFFYLREAGVSSERMMGDGSIYLYNRETRAFWQELGLRRFTVSPELNTGEIADVGCEDSELVVYGRTALMTSAQCVKKTAGLCDRHPEVLYLKDRKGARFPVKTSCGFCYNTIYNGVPLVLLDCEEEIRRVRPMSLRLSFTTESGEETAAAVRLFAGMTEGFRLSFPGSFTRGHFKRGIE